MAELFERYRYLLIFKIFILKDSFIRSRSALLAFGSDLILYCNNSSFCNNVIGVISANVRRGALCMILIPGVDRLGIVVSVTEGLDLFIG